MSLWKCQKTLSSLKWSLREGKTPQTSHIDSRDIKLASRQLLILNTLAILDCVFPWKRKMHVLIIMKKYQTPVFSWYRILSPSLMKVFATFSLYFSVEHYGHTHTQKMYATFLNCKHFILKCMSKPFSSILFTVLFTLGVLNERWLSLEK